MKRASVGVFIILAFLTSALAAEVSLDVKEHVLANGLKILMIQKPGVPRVVCHIYFKVGSINERPGITGIAHVHEHMMFKGTKVLGVTDYEADAAIDRQIDALMDQIYRERFWKPGGGDTDKIARLQKQVDELVAAEKKYVIKDELWELYMKNGGTGLNASTSNETTGYYVTLPTNKVELQMLLESDRMINANFRSPMTTLGHFVMLEMQGKPMDYYKTYRDKIRLVTKEWVLEVAKKYVRPEKAAIMIVGDWEPCTTGGDQFPGPLDKLGKVHRVSLTDPMTGEELKGR